MYAKAVWFKEKKKGKIPQANNQVYPPLTLHLFYL